ncbi:MAG: glycosyltransferase family 4 protein [Magnetococcus sp. DMHC-1]|nr:glycosyltransferase family 4 protein [Magnetococcales bacterium]
MSYGLGLQQWVRTGTLHRELAIYRLLQQMGWRITLVTYDRDRIPPDPGFPARVWTLWPYPFLRGKLRTVYYLLMPFLRWSATRRQGVLITNQAHMGWPAIVAKWVWGTPLLARSGAVFGEQLPLSGMAGEWRARLRRDLERKVYDVCDHAVVPTPELRTWVMNNYGVPPEKISVHPNNVDTDRFQPDPAITPDPLSLVTIARHHPVKRVDLAIRAIARTDYHLTVIGDGPQRTELATLAQTLEAKVTFISRVENEELPALLHRMGAYLITGITEGHPKALIEAMACGMACIGTHGQGITNILADGVNGLLCDDEPASVRQALDHLRENPALRLSLGQAAREFVVREYALTTLAHQLDAILCRLLHPDSTPRTHATPSQRTPA